MNTSYRQPRGPKAAALEGRRALVAARLLERKTVRQIARELLELPEGERPADCSPTAVGRDVLAIRGEWARFRRATVDALVGEELARLNALEAVWWPKALAGDGEATERVLAIIRERLRLFAPAGVRGAALLPAAPRELRARVEYVEDWRAVVAASAGRLLPAGPVPPGPLAPPEAPGEGGHDGAGGADGAAGWVPGGGAAGAGDEEAGR